MSEVVDIFSKKGEKSEKESEKKSDEGYSFEEIIKRNMANKQRVKDERKKENKGVVRSYRLKR